MNATRSVIFASIAGLGLLFLGGSAGMAKLSSGINATVGKPVLTVSTTSTDNTKWLGFFVGWAVLFVMFIALADIDTTAELATAFAWLLLLSIALVVGPDAFKNITGLVNKVSTPPKKGSIAS